LLAVVFAFLTSDSSGIVVVNERFVPVVDDVVVVVVVVVVVDDGDELLSTFDVEVVSVSHTLGEGVVGVPSNIPVITKPALLSMRIIGCVRFGKTCMCSAFQRTFSFELY
jgi:hypothetical protein